jgi:hypothetical protein
MALVKEQAAVKVNIRAIAKFLALAGVATVVPFYIHFQWITGALVNAILIIALFLLGIISALILCFVPSLMALAGGLLPAVLAPVVPFIMLGNTILVLIMEWFYTNIKDANKGYWLGLIIGASLKFLFLFLSVNIISRLLIKKELAAAVAGMMSWPQLATALTGGLVAWGVLKKFKRI